jgi:hypothetical protein
MNHWNGSLRAGLRVAVALLAAALGAASVAVAGDVLPSWRSASAVVHAVRA